MKKARRFLPSAAPTIPTGGKGYSTLEIIEDSGMGGNVRYRTQNVKETYLLSLKRHQRMSNNLNLAPLLCDTIVVHQNVFFVC